MEDGIRSVEDEFAEGEDDNDDGMKLNIMSANC